MKGFGSLSTLLLLVTLSHAAVIPSSEVMVLKRTHDISPAIAIQPRQDAELAVYEPHLLPRRSKAVVVGALTVLGGIATAGCSSGNPWICGGSVIAAVAATFFTIFKEYSLPSAGLPTRNARNAVLVHDRFLSTPGCTVACQFERADLPEGVWHHVGGATVDGIAHDVHHMRQGEIRGLRTVPVGNSSPGYAGKRGYIDQSTDDSFVADFYWRANKGPYDYAHITNSEIHALSDDISGYIQKYDAQGTCVDFSDKAGVMDTGLLTVNDVGVPAWYGDARIIDPMLASCGTDKIHGSAQDVTTFHVS
ncbi:hypothetical protein LTR53_014331 [Teratosphaeriaceae sp. CCFEE 6253]|nr:hypothetical protein LTR53_014331 [Teratosphaeriaceae sp. CCFEE 6253]